MTHDSILHIAETLKIRLNLTLGQPGGLRTRLRRPADTEHAPERALAAPGCKAHLEARPPSPEPYERQAAAIVDWLVAIALPCSSIFMQGPAPSRSDFLDLVERLTAEVLGLQHLRLRLANQLADGLNVGVLQAVVAAKLNSSSSTSGSGSRCDLRLVSAETPAASTLPQS